MFEFETAGLKYVFFYFSYIFSKWTLAKFSLGKSVLMLMGCRIKPKSVNLSISLSLVYVCVCVCVCECVCACVCEWVRVNVLFEYNPLLVKQILFFKFSCYFNKWKTLKKVIITIVFLYRQNLRASVMQIYNLSVEKPESNFGSGDFLMTLIVVW